MQEREPTFGILLATIPLALCCLWLLLLLSGSFGGPLPLRPKGYRVTVPFPRTLSLAEQSDVRVSGVTIGHVISLNLGKEGRTDAVVEISSKYAPIRANMHALIRQKTLLGETF